MKIGVCGGIDRIKYAAEYGFDYIETNFGALARYSDEEFNNLKNELKKYTMSCESANCFLSGENKITGENVDYEELEKILKIAFKRAEEIGIKVAVLGSSGSRNLNGYPYNKGVNQIIHFVKNYAAPLAAQHGITFVFEPLCKLESDIINTIKEGGMLASAIDLPNVGTLCDLYHMYIEGDTYDDIRELKGVLLHAHISNPCPQDDNKKRSYMKNANEFDYKGFFDALKDVGCERVTIEADTNDFALDAKEAIKIMKMYI